MSQKVTPDPVRIGFSTGVLNGKYLFACCVHGLIPARLPLIRLDLQNETEKPLSQAQGVILSKQRIKFYGYDVMAKGSTSKMKVSGCVRGFWR